MDKMFNDLKFNMEYFSKFKWIEKDPELGDYVKIKCKNDGIDEVVGIYRGVCSYRPHVVISTAIKLEYVFMDSIIQCEVLNEEFNGKE